MDNLIKYEGELDLNGLKIPCYVLEDGRRILSTTGMQKALGLDDPSDRSGTKLVKMLSSKAVSDCIPDGYLSVKDKSFLCFKGNKKITAYDASILPEICEMMLNARDCSVSKNSVLGIRQLAVIAKCDIIIRALARVGIIALVDEATGYQNERERFELQKILNAYVSEEILKWQLTFTDEFYQQIFRLWNISYTPQNIARKPSFIGKLTTKYVYDLLPKGVLLKIKGNTPKSEKGNYRYRFHQSLTPEIGKECLKKQIIEVTTLMSISESKEKFKMLFEQKYGEKLQLELEAKENDFFSKIDIAIAYNPKDHNDDPINNQNQ